ncbi:MAG: hypothetical protein JNL62_21225 [Bryobacterales bacterium]|nr:hypothetical protein [Bryobacterales bacterium]
MKLLLLLLASWCAAGQTENTYRIVREGNYWVRVDGGFLTARGPLTVVAPGKVHTQGESREDISYTVKRRVRARSYAAAKAMLAAPAVRSFTASGRHVLMVPKQGPRIVTEVDLRVPRSLPEMAFQVVDGTVSAFDLLGAVRVRAQAGSVRMDRIAGSLTAWTGGGEVRLGRIAGAVRVQSAGGGISIDGAGAGAVLETAGGEVHVGEAIGPVSAVTGGGNIHVGRAFAGVDARTRGGLVEIGEAVAQVRANTVGGAIHVGSARGADCDSGGGPIRVDWVSGQLRAATALGNIVAGIAPERVRDSFLNTAAGDITVFLPSSIAVTVQAENEAAGAMARIFSEFPEIRVLRLPAIGKPLAAQGAINGGGPVLRLSASGGIIHLKRHE